PAIAPTTLDVPADPLVGFLPPDTNPPLGKGFVDYTVQPRAGLTTGAVIDAQSSIVFDTNAPVATRSITNTIDAGAPTSTVAALPAQSLTPFAVNLTGSDDANGSGIASFALYASDNGGPLTRV